MLRNLHLSALRAFEAATRTGSFRLAADDLRLTPSAVSHAIRGLEQDLGTVLFEREGRNIRLTPEGETLMQLRAIGERSARVFDMPTHSEMTDLYQRVHDMRKEVHQLRCEVSALRGKTNSKSSKAGRSKQDDEDRHNVRPD